VDSSLVSPCVSVAVLCRSFERTRGEMTVRGIVDGVRLERPGRITLAAVVLVHGGHLLGENRVNVVLKNPVGDDASPTMSIFVNFRNVESGEYAVAEELDLVLLVAGVYWLEVYLGDRLMLRRPFRVDLASAS
jgi:hypothetical protein